MNTYSLCRRVRRAGMTLTELLVVMAIIGILMSLVAGFLPRMMESQRAYKGADMLQGALMIAHTRALRDQRPSGVRLPVDQTTGYVAEIQYIQIPENYSVGTLKSVRGSRSGSGTNLRFTGANFTGGLPPALAPVRAGDYVEICGGGILQQIQSVKANSLTIAAPMPNQNTSGGSYIYRVMRQPRLMAGEPAVRLPVNVTIDMNKSGAGLLSSTGNFPSTSFSNVTQYPQYVDILFAPSGEVLFLPPTDPTNQTTVSPSDLVVLWVRDLSYGSDTLAGCPGLIAIRCKSGNVGAHPVNISGSDPYSFARDSRSSGM